MNDCLFCRIIKGELPSRKVWEDDAVFAFLDIQPVNPGHTLVVPKAHHEDCSRTPDDVMAAVMRAARRIADAAVATVGAQGYNVGINCGKAAGQVVMHTHVHVMPRFEDDGLRHWGKKDVSEEKMADIAAAMSTVLHR